VTHQNVYRLQYLDIIMIIIIICYIYIVLFWVLIALYMEGGIS